MIHELVETRDIHEMSFEEYLAFIRTFTETELIAREPEMVRLGRVPNDLMERIKAVGLFGISIPRESGGLGWSMSQQVALTFEFTRASCVYRSRFSTTIGLATQALLQFGTPAQQKEYLPRMATGHRVMAFALTEESAGSDVRGIKSSLRAGSDTHYVLNGTKRFITNGAWADWLIVFAQSEGGLTAILVDAKSPGVSTRADEIMNGHAEGPVAAITFDNVEVPVGNVLGVSGGGLQVAMSGINHARLHVAATAVGQGTRILSEAAKFASSRRQFGERLLDLGGTCASLGRHVAEIEAAKALSMSCAESFGIEPNAHHLIAAAKLFATERVGALADTALQILGGTGIVGQHPIPRMWRDVRALRIYEGASEIHERNLGRRLAASLEGSTSYSLLRGK